MARSSVIEVAVIGGGASGLAAAKCLLEEGLRPTVFERSAHLGGVWCFDEGLPDGGSPAYRSLHTNTPKQATAFSDFPFRAGLPDYPACGEVVNYLSTYADHFRVREHIRFETRVDRVAPAGDGRWIVHTTSPAGRRAATFDAVFVCSGMFDEPVLPEYPGLAGFSGTLLHSRSYTDAAAFAGRRVLVVGTGSSGVDIALETSQVARQVWLSARNDAWTRATPAAPPRSGAWRARLARHLRLRLGLGPRRPPGYAAPPDAPFVMQPDFPILSDRLREAIRAGAVLPRPGIVRVDGNTVSFADGTSAEVDVIVCATGYVLRFPFLDEAIFRVPPAGLGLYRAVLHPDRPTLVFIGMSRASGPIMPLAEMQARWAARVLRGAIALPPPAAMHAQITARRNWIAARGGNPFRIEFEPYMDLLASEIGALPPLGRHPRLWRALLAGPPIAARYRFAGPARAANAPDILRSGNRLPPQPRAAPAPPVRDRRSWSRG